MSIIFFKKNHNYSFFLVSLIKVKISMIIIRTFSSVSFMRHLHLSLCIFVTCIHPRDSVSYIPTSQDEPIAMEHYCGSSGSWVYYHVVSHFFMSLLSFIHTFHHQHYHLSYHYIISPSLCLLMIKTHNQSNSFHFQYNVSLFLHHCWKYAL